MVAKVCGEGCVWEAIISHYAYTKEEGIQLPCTKTKNLVKKLILTLDRGKVVYQVNKHWKRIPGSRNSKFMPC